MARAKRVHRVLCLRMMEMYLETIETKRTGWTRAGPCCARGRRGVWGARPAPGGRRPNGPARRPVAPRRPPGAAPDRRRGRRRRGAPTAGAPAPPAPRSRRCRCTWPAGSAPRLKRSASDARTCFFLEGGGRNVELWVLLEGISVRQLGQL